ncbi:MAG TPA: molybdenum cofactor biosynthesis protein MoaE [Acidimicrobiia bacterium]|nr:molybdenum cofactor biosynthesis protein MoaE [Acidimicrobiia bacterium]
MEAPDAADWIAVCEDVLPTGEAMDWATGPGDGAVVCFAGVVRDSSEGRAGVTALTYEAYAEQAVARLGEVAGEARRRWPDVDRIALLHRTGTLKLSEASVVVVVSSPHRGQAFDAARFCIDTLKETVPIWKAEHWAEVSDWAASGHPIRSVRDPGD